LDNFQSQYSNRNCIGCSASTLATAGLLVAICCWSIGKICPLAHSPKKIRRPINCTSITKHSVFSRPCFSNGRANRSYWHGCRSSVRPSVCNRCG